MKMSDEERKAKARARRLRYYAANKELERKKQALYREQNLEKIKAQQKQWRDKNKKEISARRSEARSKRIEKARARERESYKRNREGYIRRSRMYEKKLKTLQCPKWLTPEQIADIQKWYNLVEEISWLSEEPLQVDHIVPLNGKNVSGLHVPWNLQILPRSMNISKGNKI